METWGPREHFGENIKVTMVKGQEHEALGNRCEEELGVLGPMQEAGRGRRPANQDFCLGKERQERENSLWRSRFNTSFAHPGA